MRQREGGPRSQPLWAGLLALALVGFSGIAASPASESGPSGDIIMDSFPQAQEAIRAAMQTVANAVSRGDWEVLRSYHLESPKFTKFGRARGRENFDEMIASETAGFAAIKNVSVEFRDPKIDVFGDVAVATSFPLIAWSGQNGERVQVETRLTVVWVNTADGWKMAHEHNTPLNGQSTPPMVQPPGEARSN